MTKVPQYQKPPHGYFKSPAIISIGFIALVVGLIWYQNYLASIDPRLVELGKIAMFAEELTIAEKCTAITAKEAADLKTNSRFLRLLKSNPADYSKETGLSLQQATENADATAHYFAVKVERLQEGLKSLADMHAVKYRAEASQSEKDYAAYIADHVGKVAARTAQLDSTKEGFCLKHAAGLFLPHVVSKH